MYLYDENSDSEEKYVHRFADGVIAAGQKSRMIGNNAVLVNNKYVYTVTKETDDYAVVSPATGSELGEHLDLLSGLARLGSCFEPNYIFYSGYPLEAAMTEREKIDFAINCLTRLGHTVYEFSDGLLVDGAIKFKLNVLDESIQLLPAEGIMSHKHRRIYRDLNILG